MESNIMSVYHKWRTVFVQIPKNASTSIHSVLSNPTDNSHNHELYIETLANNDPELMENYFSFAVIRNPYDRFVSNYEYFRDPEIGYSWNFSFEELVNMFHARGRYFYTTEEKLWWPQARFIAVKNQILVDKIIRYEELDKQWPEIVTEISNSTPNGFSLPSSFLQRANVSVFRENRPWQDYYTPQLKEKVYELYKRDFELFNYPK